MDLPRNYVLLDKSSWKFRNIYKYPAWILWYCFFPSLNSFLRFWEQPPDFHWQSIPSELLIHLQWSHMIILGQSVQAIPLGFGNWFRHGHVTYQTSPLVKFGSEIFISKKQGISVATADCAYVHLLSTHTQALWEPLHCTKSSEPALNLCQVLWGLNGLGLARLASEELRCNLLDSGSLNSDPASLWFLVKVSWIGPYFRHYCPHLVTAHEMVIFSHRQAWPGWQHSRWSPKRTVFWEIT